MADPILYRKRLIPEECIRLKDDIVLHRDDRLIVTAWNSLKPRKDLHHGCSCYYLNDGIKVSKFYREDNSLIFWYCDIVSYAYDKASDTYIVTDLLADVIIYPDGFVKVVDIGELAAALESGLLTEDMLKKSLLRLDRLLEMIYSGGFKALQEQLESYEKNGQTYSGER